MAWSIASGDVLVPPTTSTSGMVCGGLKGCPIRTRSGCLHFDCMTLGVIPDELDAIRELAGVASSISANNFILKSGRSGPFSWTCLLYTSDAADERSSVDLGGRRIIK